MKVQSLTKKFMLLLVCSAMLFTMSLLAGCSGSDGSNGAAGAAGAPGANGQDLTATAKPESCAICHSDAGAAHQSVYNDYKDTTLTATIDTVTSVATGTTYSTTVAFTIKKNGLPYTPTMSTFNAEFDQKTVYAVLYSSTSRTFDSSKSLLTTNSANVSYVANGQYTLTQTGLTFAPELSNAEVYMYVAKGKLTTEGMQLYSDVANAGKAYGDVTTYVSTANVSACENCHGAPYKKHGYRMAVVSNLSDFAACKTCHYDSRDGHDAAWGLLVDDTAAYAAQSGVTTTAQNAKYAYKARIMNDVHMSHAMEFAYPQSMANCSTCHAGKLTSILTDANFTIETCRSCHPVTGTGGTDAKRAPALKTLMLAKFSHSGVIDSLYADALPQPTCNGCHNGGIAPAFSTIHTGYNSMIYAANGTKYADGITTVISSATMSANVLDIKFNVTDSLATGFTVTPMVQVSFYGYNTKDFILSNHTNDSNGKKMEKTIGTANTLFTEVPTGVANSWEVTLDLSKYAKVPSIPDMIKAGTIKRLEIAVLPSAKNANGEVIALNAPSKTVDIAANGFVTYYSPIVDANKCNKCHDALGTTFHTGDRGGNVTVCRMCHTPMNGGSHLEMQSRSIDSYVHAIHSFQAFDIKNINFSDPVQALEYEHHIESTYPNFTKLNCESCHYAGTYGVPDQSKSMPGLLSSSATVTDRNIGAVPSYVTGPATRACGGCHRAEFINEDNAAGLAAFNQHTEVNGYMLENKTGVLDTVIDTIMSIFK